MPIKFDDYIVFTASAIEESELITWQEALNSKYRSEWMNVMKAEITYLNIKGTCSIAELSQENKLSQTFNQLQMSL